MNLQPRKSQHFETRIVPVSSQVKPEGQRIHLAAGTAIGGGGLSALNSVIQFMRDHGLQGRLVVSNKVELENPADNLVNVHVGRLRAVLSEVWGPSRSSYDVYVGMSDRLPIVRRPRQAVFVAQNPHLYGAATTGGSLRLTLRLMVLRRWACHSARRSDLVVAATRATAREVRLTTRLAPERIVVRPIPPVRISATGRPPASVISRIVLVGDVYAYKNFAWAITEIDAWAGAIQRRVEVVHIGRHVESAPSAELMRAARDSVHASIRILGGQPHPDAMRELSKADAFLFPSSRESFGIPLVEAMALGIPALCTDIPQFREIAADAALFFDLTPGSLRTVLHTADDPAVREGCIRRGHALSVSQGGWDVFSPIVAGASA